LALLFIFLALPSFVKATSADVSYSTNNSTNEVTQYFEFFSDKEIKFSASFCNGLTCGDADPECYSNKWIPGGWIGNTPQSIEIPFLAGSKVKKVYLKVGSSSDQINEYGYWNQDWIDGNTDKPDVASFGSQTIPSMTVDYVNNLISFDLNYSHPLLDLGIFESFFVKEDTAGNKRICGISEDEWRDIRARFDLTSYKNPASYIKIGIVWSKPALSTTAQQKIVLNSEVPGSSSINVDNTEVIKDSQATKDEKVPKLSLDSNFANPIVGWTTNILNQAGVSTDLNTQQKNLQTFVSQNRTNNFLSKWLSRLKIVNSAIAAISIASLNKFINYLNTQGISMTSVLSINQSIDKLQSGEKIWAFVNNTNNQSQLVYLYDYKNGVFMLKTMDNKEYSISRVNFVKRSPSLWIAKKK